MTFPEYRNRHLFTARLRIFLFCGFLFFYAMWLSDVIPATHPTILIVTTASLLTFLCYYNIIKGRWLIFSFIVEILADVISITILIALLGGIHSEMYLIYFCYCTIGGLFYNYRLATFLAVTSITAYMGLCLLTAYGVFPWASPFLGWNQPLPHGSVSLPLWAHPLLLGLLLICAVYAVKIGHNFSQWRERTLETRNKELIALQRISGMIRTTTPLPIVADRVVHGLVEGLDFAGCLLLLADYQRKQLVCYPPHNRPEVDLAQSILGVQLRKLTLPLEILHHSLAQQIQERKIAFRRDLRELINDLSPGLDLQRVELLQHELNIRKIVIIPLVAEEELLGCLIGFSQDAFVEERTLATLETFANQAALVLRVTLLIEQLKYANQELAEANRVKSEFLATMSHELRTPLTAIIGFSELLMEETMGPIAEEQRESLREILNNGANLLELINNILDLAKAESGRLELHLAEFDLRELLERTHRTLGSLIARKRHHFELRVATDLPLIEADERRVQQIVLNLLGNAIKFTPDDGTITVEAQVFDHLAQLQRFPWQEYVDEPTAFAQGGLLLQISDSGIGIPKEHLRSIFEMFHQVDSSVTRQYEGTGLGLALVKQLVMMHHGTIWAVSEAGKGATFNCLLPLVQPKVLPEVQAVQGEIAQPIPATIRMPV